MANEEHLTLLKQGVEIWNAWRSANLGEVPDFSGASFIDDDISGATLFNADFMEANLTSARLHEADLVGALLIAANLSRATLTKADLSEAKLINANLNEAILTEANFRNADLINAKFINAVLSKANFTRANLIRADFHRANLDGANFSGANLTQANLVGVSLVEANLSGTNLAGANLNKANLRRANLSQANLRLANFNQTNLTETNLTGVQALGTNFLEVKLTGACLEDWSINSDTELDDIDCQYIYLKTSREERRPSSGDFLAGDFVKLFQRALSTVDLIFRNGVDWKALLISLEKLKIEAEGAELSIQAIENKNDGAFVVRVNVPEEANKEEIEKFLKREYELALKAIDEQYQYQLKAKDEQIEIYRQQSADLMEIAKLMASRPIINNAIAESRAMSDRNINTSGGNYIESNSGTYVQGNYINMSQDLTQSAQQLQEIFNHFKSQGMTEEAAQQKVAEDIATEAASNPTVKDKLVKWGQSLGDATVTDVVKGAVKLALRSAGVPLP